MTTPASQLSPKREPLVRYKAAADSAREWGLPGKRAESRFGSYDRSETVVVVLGHIVD